MSESARAVWGTLAELGRTSTADLRRTVRRLYRDTWGFEIPAAESRRIRAAKTDPLYGEITPGGVGGLLDHLQLGSRDVFYDLGSGVGKVVVQAAMTAPLRRCVGIELSETRHRMANRVLRQARREGHVVARRTVFRNEDMMEADLKDATVVYCCTTAFSHRSLRQLTRKLSGLNDGLRFVTSQWLFTRHGFREVGELRLDMSWKRRSPVYVYRLDKP